MSEAAESPKPWRYRAEICREKIEHHARGSRSVSVPPSVVLLRRRETLRGAPSEGDSGEPFCETGKVGSDETSTGWQVRGWSRDWEETPEAALAALRRRIKEEAHEAEVSIRRSQEKLAKARENKAALDAFERGPSPS